MVLADASSTIDANKILSKEGREASIYVRRSRRGTKRIKYLSSGEESSEINEPSDTLFIDVVDSLNKGTINKAGKVKILRKKTNKKAEIVNNYKSRPLRSKDSTKFDEILSSETKTIAAPITDLNVNMTEKSLKGETSGSVNNIMNSLNIKGSINKPYESRSGFYPKSVFSERENYSGLEDYQSILVKYRNLLIMRNTEAEFLAEKFRKECSDLEKIDQKVVETLRQTNSELTTTVTEQASEIIHIRKQLQEFCLQHSPGDKDAKANEAHREVIDELKQLLEKERHATKEQTFKYKELLQKITEIEKRHELQIFKLNEQLCKEKLTIKSLQEVAKAKAALETENEQLKIILQEKPTKEDLNNLIEAHNEIDRLNNLLENEKREKNSFELKLSEIRQKTNIIIEKYSTLKEEYARLNQKYDREHNEHKLMLEYVNFYSKISGITVTKNFTELNSFTCRLEESQTEFKLIFQPEEVEYVPRMNVEFLPECFQEELIFKNEMLQPFFAQLNQALEFWRGSRTS